MSSYSDSFIQIFKATHCVKSASVKVMIQAAVLVDLVLAFYIGSSSAFQMATNIHGGKKLLPGTTGVACDHDTGMPN